MNILQRPKKRMGEKGITALGTVMGLFVLAALALILVWFSWEHIGKRGGEATKGLIRGVNDFDGDGIANNVDRCRPAACDPGDRKEQIDRNPESAFYGCLRTQGVTLELYADTCNTRDTAQQTP